MAVSLQGIAALGREVAESSVLEVADADLSNQGILLEVPEYVGKHALRTYCLVHGDVIQPKFVRTITVTRNRDVVVAFASVTECCETGCRGNEAIEISNDLADQLVTRRTVVHGSRRSGR